MIRKSALSITTLAVIGTLAVAGCTSTDTSKNDTVKTKSDVSAVTQWGGWDPSPNPLPQLNCTDNSYASAVKDGLTLGLEGAKPYNYIDPATNKPLGIDVDIVHTALKYAGITKLKSVVMPFDSLVPSLKGKKIDVINANIHVTEPRLSQLQFSSPGWWYGPQMVVRKGDEKRITSYDDLIKSDITVATVGGSINQTYLEAVKAPNITIFKDKNTELAAVTNGSVDVALEDPVTMGEYIKDNPNSNLVLINAPIPSEIITKYGYGYARYGFRLEDCSLNAAFSRALSEIRDNGVVLRILKTYGLGESNVTIPGQ